MQFGLKLPVDNTSTYWPPRKDHMLANETHSSIIDSSCLCLCPANDTMGMETLFDKQNQTWNFKLSERFETFSNTAPNHHPKYFTLTANIQNAFYVSQSVKHLPFFSVRGKVSCQVVDCDGMRSKNIINRWYLPIQLQPHSKQPILTENSIESVQKTTSQPGNYAPCIECLCSEVRPMRFFH